jgi:hypothetical protein
MNEHLARVIANIILEKWDGSIDTLSSEEIYQELVARGEQVPENAMREILDTFIKAGIIEASKHVDREAIIQDGAIVITGGNISQLKDLEFD